MNGVNLLSFMSHFHDTENKTTVPTLDSTANLDADLKLHKFDVLVNPTDEYVLGQGNSNHWLKFCIRNIQKTDADLVLTMSPAVTAEVDFYPQKEGARAFKTGASKAMSTRDIFSATYDFNILLLAGETQSFYVRINSFTQAYLFAEITEKPNYLKEKYTKEAIDGIYVGILLGLILYTILLYLSVRQSSSMLYILWSTSLLVFFACLDGRVLQYITPNSPLLSFNAFYFSYPIMVIFSALFGRHFINLKSYPRLNIVGNVIIACFVIGLIVAYQFGPLFYFKVCAAFAIINILYFGFIATTYGVIKHKSITAKYLLIAQAPLMLCALDRCAFILGLTPQKFLPYEPKVGLVAEMILLAYYIGITIHKEKSEAQDIAFEQLKISNDLKSNYNAELESEIERNTSEIRSMNQDLAQQAQKLVESNEAKSKFFANISHEFRTPLTLIQGPLISLLEKGEIPPQSEAVINGAIRNSKALQGLIDQLLTLSKFDAQSLALSAAKTNISDATRTIVTQFDSLAQSKGVKIAFNTNAPEVDVYVDYEKLQIMLSNLISNALKFTAENGQVKVNIDLPDNIDLSSSEYTTDKYLKISVSDNGYGIPEDDLEFVFDRFFQSSNSVFAGTGVGTGIGLSLVQELAYLHAGHVTVTSTVQTTQGQKEASGSQFVIHLPLGSAHLKSNEICEQPPIEGTQQKPLTHTITSLSTPVNDLTESNKTATILVVDDNSDMRAYIRSILEPSYKVIEAIDGLHGEQVLKQAKPDIILTDLMMPKRDGLQFVESIKKDSEFANTPVIMLTAKAGQNDRLKGLLAEVDDYLTKPFDANELKLCIRNLLTKHAQFSAFYQQDKLSQSSVETLSESQQYLTKLKNVIEQHLSKSSFGVNELANELHVSKATLQRHMAEHSEFTPSEFIRHCRLEKARQLTKSGKIRTVRELAAKVGFTQASYFSRLYRKAFNASPLEDE